LFDNMLHVRHLSSPDYEPRPAIAIASPNYRPKIEGGLPHSTGNLSTPNMLILMISEIDSA
jgi:hypothetical protein